MAEVENNQHLADVAVLRNATTPKLFLEIMVQADNQTHLGLDETKSAIHRMLRLGLIKPEIIKKESPVLTFDYTTYATDYDLILKKFASLNS